MTRNLFDRLNVLVKVIGNITRVKAAVVLIEVFIQFICCALGRCYVIGRLVDIIYRIVFPIVRCFIS